MPMRHRGPPPRALVSLAAARRCAGSRARTDRVMRTAARPLRCRGAWRDSRFDDSAALLAQELGDVIRSTTALARRARSLPAAKWLCAGPRAGCRPGAFVGVAHASFGFVEKSRDLIGTAGED